MAPIAVCLRYISPHIAPDLTCCSRDRSDECHHREALAARRIHMATFTIDAENNIAAHAGSPANADNLGVFASEKELGNVAADWSAARLVEVWNSFAGVTPFDDLKAVKKFTLSSLRASESNSTCANLCAGNVHAV